MEVEEEEDVMSKVPQAEGTGRSTSTSCSLAPWLSCNGPGWRSEVEAIALVVDKNGDAERLDDLSPACAVL